MAKYHFYTNLPDVRDGFRRVQMSDWDSDVEAIAYILAQFPTRKFTSMHIRDVDDHFELFVDFDERGRG